MPSKTEWVGTCVHLRSKDLDDYDDTARDITYRTFLKHLGGEKMRELNKDLGYRSGDTLHIGTDYHIQFSRGRWKGKPALCMMWSSIHHIWLLNPSDERRSSDRITPSRSTSIAASW